MIRSVTYAAEQPGPKFLVMAAVHGNEKCGTVAANRVMQEIDEGRVTLARGQVTFVPIANPRAYELNKRYVERNLNRYCVPMEKPDSYEARLSNILCPMLADCDVHLSIHSFTGEGEPFVFVAPNDAREHAFAASFGAHALLTGWEEAYAASGRVRVEGDEESTGTVEYARRHGALAVTLECGQHLDPEGPEVAYHAIRNSLRYLGMTTEPKIETSATSVHLIDVKKVFYHEDDGKFPKSWRHLDPIKKGETMAVKADGQILAAPEDGFIVLPKANFAVGEEWFYFGAERKA